MDRSPSGSQSNNAASQTPALATEPRPLAPPVPRPLRHCPTSSSASPMSSVSPPQASAPTPSLFSQVTPAAKLDRASFPPPQFDSDNSDSPASQSKLSLSRSLPCDSEEEDEDEEPLPNAHLQLLRRSPPVSRGEMEMERNGNETGKGEVEVEVREKRRRGAWRDGGPGWGEGEEEEVLSAEEMQDRIREISRDGSLSEAEKNGRRQAILSRPFQRKRRLESRDFIRAMNAVWNQVSWSTVVDAETGGKMMGCEHYARNCKIRAECCGMWVVCRLCHDTSFMDHAIDRFETREVLCMVCWKVQDVGERCVRCGVEFARYYCGKCKFFDNSPGKDIYHCDKCKICRVGKGIGNDNFHCDRCDACVSTEFAKNHRCLKKSLDANCPICGLYLFTSTKPVVFMRCGHTMHSHCFDVYTEEHFICPLCHKALTNMKSYYLQIDEAVKREVMPIEHRNKVAEVLCHDCDERSHTAFHFLYLKCMKAKCGSYNTRLLRTFQQDEGAGCSGDGNNVISISNDSGLTGSDNNRSSGREGDANDIDPEMEGLDDNMGSL